MHSPPLSAFCAGTAATTRPWKVSFAPQNGQATIRVRRSERRQVRSKFGW